MSFRLINKTNWTRKEIFDHYFSNIPCTYSITTKIDITKIRKANLKLYPTMLYCLTTIANRHDEFKTSFNEEGLLGIYTELCPCYTIFHKDTETFSNLWTQYVPSLSEFRAAYEKDLSIYGQQHAFIAKPNLPPNYFTVSMLPWTSFEGFNLNLQKGYDYLKPIFTMGKYFQEDHKILLPIAIQVHHAVCDGFHVCRFINELQELLNSPSLNS